MNFTILGIQLLILIIVFSLMIVIPMTINPVSFISDFPPEIQEQYYESQNKKSQKETLSKVMVIKKVIVVITALFVCTWLAHLAGARSFIEGTFTALVYVVGIAAFDTFILDWIFFPRFKRFRLPGTEHMDKEYKQKWFHLKIMLPVVPLGVGFALLVGILNMWISLVVNN